jgi:hypothetical protein
MLPQSPDVRNVVVSGQAAYKNFIHCNGRSCAGAILLSYTPSPRQPGRMRKPQRIELEFAILLFVVGGGMA